MSRAPVRRSDPDPDPSNVAGLVYRILSRWRVMLGALVAVLVIVGLILLVFHLVGPIRIEIGPIGIEPIPVSQGAPAGPARAGPWLAQSAGV